MNSFECYKLLLFSDFLGNASEMTMSFDLWLGYAGRGRALDVSLILAVVFVGAMVIIHQEFSRMEGLQGTSDVIDSCGRIAVGTSFCWMDGKPIEGQHSICTTQHATSTNDASKYE